MSSRVVQASQPIWAGCGSCSTTQEFRKKYEQSTSRAHPSALMSPLLLNPRYKRINEYDLSYPVYLPPAWSPTVDASVRPALFDRPHQSAHPPSLNHYSTDDDIRDYLEYRKHTKESMRMKLLQQEMDLRETVRNPKESKYAPIHKRESFDEHSHRLIDEEYQNHQKKDANVARDSFCQCCHPHHHHEKQVARDVSVQTICEAEVQTDQRLLRKDTNHVFRENKTYFTITTTDRDKAHRRSQSTPKQTTAAHENVRTSHATVKTQSEVDNRDTRSSSSQQTSTDQPQSAITPISSIQTNSLRPPASQTSSLELSESSKLTWKEAASKQKTARKESPRANAQDGLIQRRKTNIQVPQGKTKGCPQSQGPQPTSKVAPVISKPQLKSAAAKEKLAVPVVKPIVNRYAQEEVVLTKKDLYPGNDDDALSVQSYDPDQLDPGYLEELARSLGRGPIRPSVHFESDAATRPIDVPADFRNSSSSYKSVDPDLNPSLASTPLNVSARTEIPQQMRSSMEQLERLEKLLNEHKSGVSSKEHTSVTDLRHSLSSASDDTWSNISDLNRRATAATVAEIMKGQPSSMNPHAKQSSTSSAGIEATKTEKLITTTVPSTNTPAQGLGPSHEEWLRQLNDHLRVVEKQPTISQTLDSVPQARLMMPDLPSRYDQLES